MKNREREKQSKVPPQGEAVGGVVPGGLPGALAMEIVNPEEEDGYWRQHYSKEPYYDQTYSFDDYQGAYRTGYQGYSRAGISGRSFEEAEPEMQREYERTCGKSRLQWKDARIPARAAWERVRQNFSRFVGFDVLDNQDEKIGTLQCLWTDRTGEPAFIGVKTGWIFGKTHLVPAENVRISERSRRIRIPYSKQKVKDAPAYDCEGEVDEAREWEVRQYYGVASPRQPQPEQQMQPAQPPRAGQAVEETKVPLSQEELKVGKRQVEAGGVRLRKVIRTEIVNQPVELEREEVVIERVPVSEGAAQQATRFEGEEFYIPLRREEVVIEKQARVREEVRARKEKQSDQQQVSEEVRREDVEIEETGEAKRTDRTRGGSADEIREREERPRSQRRREP